ncbi:MAG: YncE family protein [Acetobacteraceae bacterium]|nr:YncE family protein [Acetobacteraceae bacterium]
MPRHLIVLAALMGLSPIAAWAGTNDVLIGLDGKIFFEASGPRIDPGGKDALLVLDVGDPAHPKIRASLPLMNSVLGPPTNLQITPDGKLGLLANSVVPSQVGDRTTTAPDNKLFVVDLEANPPKLIDTITVGRQPSGLSISHKGDLALIANRASKDISVLSIEGKTMRHIAEVPIGDEVAMVTITPDGRRAFAVKNLANKVAVLAIDGQKVTYDKAADIPAGFGVYNVDVTTDGHYAIAANTGVGGDGNIATVMQIDATAEHAHSIDYVTVGEGPEGFAISPDGHWAVAPLLKGSPAPHDAWSYTRNGAVALLQIGSNGKLSLVNDLPVGAIPEAVAFSPDSKFIYVGNYADRNLQVFQIRDGKLADTGVVVDLPGQPASMRGPAR